MLKALAFLTLLGASAVLPFEAGAEGRCPPGQYPIGGPGMLGCAPIPTAAPAPVAPTATGEWLLTWGAIASSATTGSTGVTTGKKSKAEALSEAISICQRKGAADCREDIAYENSCVALVDPPVGSQWSGGVATAPTIERAIEVATARCKKSGAPACTVAHTDCSKPVFKAY